MGYGRYAFRWAPYVSVGQKLAKAKKKAAMVAKKQKREPSPVELQGRKITTSFWGRAWCDNLEAYSDFSNRLPRGATYVRNGSVVDLVISQGSIEAIVAGSEPYTVKISISELSKATWKKIKQDCSASIDSLIDLLAGRLSDSVMRRLTEKKCGCFPDPSEIKLKCSCPDYSYCCKHIAAVMYGIGSRLDSKPELLFLLRGVDHLELVDQAVSKENLDRELALGAAGELSGQDLGEIFGIDLDSSSATTSSAPSVHSTTSTKPKRAISPTKAGGSPKGKRPARKTKPVDAANNKITEKITTKKAASKKVTPNVSAEEVSTKKVSTRRVSSKKAVASAHGAALSKKTATRPSRKK
jgi:uncharacterized Zn finger protein